MSVRLDWAQQIAKEVAAGSYKGGAYGASLAAEAIRNSRKPVPASLIPFLPAVKREELEGGNEQFQEAA